MLESLPQAFAIELAFELARVFVIINVDFVASPSRRSVEDRELPPGSAGIREENTRFPEAVLSESCESFEVHRESAARVRSEHFRLGAVLAPSLFKPGTENTLNLRLGHKLGGVNAKEGRVNLALELIEVELILEGDCGFSDRHGLLELPADCFLFPVRLLDSVLRASKLVEVPLDVADSAFKFLVLLFDEIDRGLHGVFTEVGQRFVEVAQDFSSECVEWIFFRIVNSTTTLGSGSGRHCK